jgi:hypothetical protein
MPDHLGVNPSDGIEIFNRAALVDGRPVDDLRVWMPLANDLDLHWTTSEHLASTGRVQLSFEHGLFGAISAEGTTHDTTGFGTILHEALGEPSSAVDAVEMHWVNLPRIGATRSDKGHELTFSFDGWHIELGQRSDLVDTERMARREGARILVSHSATLSRTDDEHFQMEDSLEALATFQVAVSFGLGRFVAPLLPVGLSGGTPCWQAIRAWRVDGRFGQEGVAFPLDGNDFAEPVARVGTELLEPVSGASVRYLAMHAVVAHLVQDAPFGPGTRSDIPRTLELLTRSTASYCTPAFSCESTWSS